MKYRKTAIAILALALITAFFSICLLPEPPIDSADEHICRGEYCILCLVSTLLTKATERLLPFLWAVPLSVLSVLLFARLFVSSNDLSARYTPVFLKVKLLN